ncbi:MAG: MFS transporter [Betaproteobacteria bacterium HGW-Betaproteobacteria-18]|nr:MAG: MFS transporter [Betaproteobacteria bacterium HGW-Betaproteobacteria-5]PKO40566.1 MAG: MFS transporter [Betaproteobacteria bacterium HGW-Betaproteobacteria-6]PKO63068.1 MAG: MFS transporter [Betaproteobacteria bacterium HGW-Betaproteobacteria-18]
MKNRHMTSSLAAIDLTEFKEAWSIVLLAVVGVAISINAALLYGFGVLVIPLQQAFGWERGELQAAISFLFGGAVIGLQLVGWANLRYGIKRVTLASFFLMALGYLATTQIWGSIWSLYAAFFLLPICGMGALAVTWTQLLNLWFMRNRGLALAIGLSGTGITAALIPRLLGWGVENWDWRAAFVILATLNLVIGIPLTLWWFRLPGELKRASPGTKNQSEKIVERTSLAGIDFRHGVCAPKFWVCNIALSLVVSAVVGLVTSTVPMLRDRGFSTAEATMIFSYFGFALIAGRLVVGYLLDRFWPPGIAALSLALPAVGCLIYLSDNNSIQLISLAGVLIGLGAGAEFDIAAFLIARYFGLKDYGRLFGVHQGLITVASAAAPLLFASMLAKSGSYSSMLTYSVVSTLIGSFMLLTLGRSPSFVQEVYPEHSRRQKLL